MTLKINNEDIELKYSFRINIFFEQISKKSLDLANLNAEDLLTLFYCATIASLQKAKKPIIAMTDFLDIIDDNGGELALVSFSKWFIEVMTAQYELINSDESINSKKKPKGTAKKKN